MTEKELQNKLTSWLTRRNIKYYKTTGGLVYQKIGVDKFQPYALKKGFSDLIIPYQGKTYYVELKSKTKLRTSQINNANYMLDQGIDYYVLHVDQWEEFKERNKVNDFEVAMEIFKYER